MLVDGVAFVGTFLVEKHFKADIQPVGDGDSGTGTDMDARLAVMVALVAVHLADVAAQDQLAFDDLGMEQGRSSQSEGQQ